MQYNTISISNATDLANYCLNQSAQDANNCLESQHVLAEFIRSRHPSGNDDGCPPAAGLEITALAYDATTDKLGRYLRTWWNIDAA